MMWTLSGEEHTTHTHSSRVWNEALYALPIIHIISTMYCLTPIIMIINSPSPASTQGQQSRKSENNKEAGGD